MFVNKISLVVITLIFLSGCQPARIYTMEKFGVHKRDLLVSDVKRARDSQEAAKKQFKSALEKFSSVVKFDGAALKKKYDQLSSEFKRSESRAEEVKKRINSVDDVSKALFREWETEIKQYSNDNMRRISQQKLAETQTRYAKLIDAMKQVEKKIEPVLTTFRDQVLFLKHNLNAQAIASIQDELVSVQSNVASLIKEMETSISEANTFINSMSKE
ncbi:DUF2959 domain-containing protein [Candidatus Halobeggiatoa sp. HSG11]|nr:DUF2959 domain-containing protein [Candidatus Halobeggiatoa sp. HSG11]